MKNPVRIISVVEGHCCFPTRFRSEEMDVYLEGVGTTRFGRTMVLGTRTVLRAGSVGQVHRSSFSCSANAPGLVKSTCGIADGFESGQVDTWTILDIRSAERAEVREATSAISLDSLSWVIDCEDDCVCVGTRKGSMAPARAAELVRISLLGATFLALLAFVPLSSVWGFLEGVSPLPLSFSSPQQDDLHPFITG